MAGEGYTVRIEARRGWLIAAAVANLATGGAPWLAPLVRWLLQIGVRVTTPQGDA